MLHVALFFSRTCRFNVSISPSIVVISTLSSSTHVSTVIAGYAAIPCFDCLATHRVSSVRTNRSLENHSRCSAWSPHIAPNVCGETIAAADSRLSSPASPPASARGLRIVVSKSQSACCGRDFFSGATCLNGNTASRNRIDARRFSTVSPRSFTNRIA